MTFAIALLAAAAAESPKPIDPQNWISPADYPPEALRNGWEGSVRVKLTIDAAGAVQSCEVLLSSGFGGLDSSTCDLMRNRARFEPARDEAGRPVIGYSNRSTHWQIPREGPIRSVRIEMIGAEPRCAVEGGFKLRADLCGSALDLVRAQHLSLPTTLQLPVSADELSTPN